MFSATKVLEFSDLSLMYAGSFWGYFRGKIVTVSSKVGKQLYLSFLSFHCYAKPLLQQFDSTLCQLSKDKFKVYRFSWYVPMFGFSGFSDKRLCFLFSWGFLLCMCGYWSVLNVSNQMWCFVSFLFKQMIKVWFVHSRPPVIFRWLDWSTDGLCLVLLNNQISLLL